MRIGMLANANSWYARDLRRAIADAGCEPLLLDFRSLVAKTDEPYFVARDYEDNTHDLSQLGALIIRTMPPGSLEQVVFRMDVLGQLEACGVAVVNSPRAIECAVDKYLTTAKLAANGLPVPQTATCETVDQAMEVFESFGRDVVLKPLFGAEGRGIVRLTDEETAFRVFKSLRLTDAVLYLQRFVSHRGFDVRAMVLDGRVVASMKRTNELDFRTNVNQRGRAEAHDATEQECDLAIRAAAATGVQIAGVDIIRDEQERAFVLEVNAVPGWKALSSVTKTDIAALLIQSLKADVL